MDYASVYDKFISHYKSRKIPDGEKTNWHHIIPKCCGGKDDRENFVCVTIREHKFLHHLLTKMYAGKPAILLALAYTMMSGAKGVLKGAKRSRTKEYSLEVACLVPQCIDIIQNKHNFNYKRFNIIREYLGFRRFGSATKHAVAVILAAAAMHRAGYKKVTIRTVVYYCGEKKVVSHLNRMLELVKPAFNIEKERYMPNIYSVKDDVLALLKYEDLSNVLQLIKNSCNFIYFGTNSRRGDTGLSSVVKQKAHFTKFFVYRKKSRVLCVYDSLGSLLEVINDI